jgi:hypothetical protein
MTQVAPVQVIEQFFFSHEAFNMQRHIFFTTVILVSAMFGAYRICPLPLPPKLTCLPADSIAHYVRSRRNTRDNRRCIRHRTRIHLPSGVFPKTHQFARSPHHYPRICLRCLWRTRHGAFTRTRAWQGMDTSRRSQDMRIADDRPTDRPTSDTGTVTELRV